jgi:hypothetical protein
MVHVTDREGRFSHQTIQLPDAGILPLRPPDPTLAAAGLVIGIAGTASATVGAIMGFGLLFGSMGSNCETGCEPRPSWVVPTAITTVIVGAVATPIGWTMFGKNRKLYVEKEPLRSGPPQHSEATSKFSVGVAQVTGGAMATGVFTF